MVWRHWDKRTSRAVLALYRDADSDRLAAAGASLSRLTCPALVLWGDRDPYLPTKFAEAYAAKLPNSEQEIVGGAVGGAGH